jgi:adenylyltransferase/sulfurtransferase
MERLKRARVLVVGVGGLGSPAALHLAAAGVGTLVLVDHDIVEPSNLHRQILHRTDSLGRQKVLSAAERLCAQFPGVRVETHAERLDAGNLPRLFRDVDFIVDGTDGAEAKFVINDGAVLTGQPYCHAGIVGFQGQLMTVLPGRTACYRCLFPEPPEPGDVPSCQEAGILGAVAGVIGSLQASEAVSYLCGAGPRLVNRLLTYDALTARLRSIKLSRSPDCPVCRPLPATDLAMRREQGYGS